MEGVKMLPANIFCSPLGFKFFFLSLLMSKKIVGEHELNLPSALSSVMFFLLSSIKWTFPLKKILPSHSLNSFPFSRILSFYLCLLSYIAALIISSTFHLSLLLFLCLCNEHLFLSVLFLIFSITLLIPNCIVIVFSHLLSLSLILSLSAWAGCFLLSFSHCFFYVFQSMLHLSFRLSFYLLCCLASASISIASN